VYSEASFDERRLSQKFLCAAAPPRSALVFRRDLVPDDCSMSSALVHRPSGLEFGAHHRQTRRAAETPRRLPATAAILRKLELRLLVTVGSRAASFERPFYRIKLLSVGTAFSR